MIRLLIITNSLNPGGAERQLVILLKNIDKSQFSPAVVTYYSGGDWEEQVRKVEGVKLYSLDLKGPLDLYGLTVKLKKVVADFKPDILYGLLGDACTAAFIQGRLLGRYKVAWGLRASYIDFNKYSFFSRLIYRVNAILSRYVNVIIANSWAGHDYHVAQGYSKDKIVVIPNGIDTAYFHLDHEKGADFRKQVGIAPETMLVGRIGRLDPMKGYETFLEAARILARSCPEVYFAVAGSGKLSSCLQSMAKSMGLADRVFWLGTVHNLLHFYNACTITVSSALGEGFPNVVAESLACETPCVVTDVGDSARVLGPGGEVVPPSDPEAMAVSCKKLLGMNKYERADVGKKGREHVEQSFSVRSMVKKTENVLRNIYEL